MVELDPARPLGLGVEATSVCLLRERGEEGRVTLAERRGLACVGKPLERVLADRLHEQEAAVADRLQQARVDEHRDAVEVRGAHLFGGGEGERAREDGDAGQQPAGVLVEQVVAPLDRGSERSLALVRVPRPAREERQRRLEAVQEPLRPEELRARGRQLEREGQAVEAPADRLDGGIRPELGPDRSRALHEQDRGVARRQRLQPVLPLAVDVQRRPARHEHAEAARGREHVGDRRSRIEEVLEGVEHEQELAFAQEAGQVVGGADGLCDLREDELAVRQPDERHPEDAVVQGAVELGGDLEREPRLAGAAGPRHGEQPRTGGEQGNELLHLALPSDERCRGDRQVRGVERAQRREVPFAELVQPLAADQVLEPMLPEVEHGGPVDELARRLGEDDLPAVGGRRDPRRPVDVHPHVALVGDDRLSGVDPHAGVDGPGASAARASSAAATASVALVNTTKNASPCVSTSIPPCRANASLSARLCSARSSAYRAPCSWRSRVDPSTSVKRKVTVPPGRSRIVTARSSHGVGAVNCGFDQFDNPPISLWVG